MKTFLPTFLAVLIAAGLALFVYDRFVLVPRLATRAGHGGQPGQRARTGQDIAVELDASVERSVAGARSAFDEQARPRMPAAPKMEKQAEQMRPPPRPPTRWRAPA